MIKVLGGCGNTPRAIAEPVERSDRAEPYACLPRLRSGHLNAPSQRETLRALLGRPQPTASGRVGSRHGGVLSERQRLQAWPTASRVLRAALRTGETLRHARSSGRSEPLRPIQGEPLHEMLGVDRPHIRRLRLRAQSDLDRRPDGAPRVLRPAGRPDPGGVRPGPPVSQPDLCEPRTPRRGDSRSEPSARMGRPPCRVVREQNARDPDGCRLVRGPEHGCPPVSGMLADELPERRHPLSPAASGEARGSRRLIERIAA